MPSALRVLVLLTGLGLLAAAALAGVQTRRFVAVSAASEGVVSRLNAGGSHPQIEFHTADGSVVSYPQGGMIAGFRTGQPVRVLFDPANPRSTARADTFGSLWGGSVVLAVCGAILFGLALAPAFLPMGFYARGS